VHNCIYINFIYWHGSLGSWTSLYVNTYLSFVLKIYTDKIYRCSESEYLGIDISSMRNLSALPSRWRSPLNALSRRTSSSSGAILSRHESLSASPHLLWPPTTTSSPAEIDVLSRCAMMSAADRDWGNWRRKMLTFRLRLLSNKLICYTCSRSTETISRLLTR